MATLITKSNSQEYTNSVIDAEKYGFTALSIEAVSRGIGRKATDQELIYYLSEDAGPFIGIEEAFEKYLNQK
jgi:hypothetical protein